MCVGDPVHIVMQYSAGTYGKPCFIMLWSHLNGMIECNIFSSHVGACNMQPPKFLFVTEEWLERSRGLAARAGWIRKAGRHVQRCPELWQQNDFFIVRHACANNMNSEGNATNTKMQTLTNLMEFFWPLPEGFVLAKCIYRIIFECLIPNCVLSSISNSELV